MTDTNNTLPARTGGQGPHANQPLVTAGAPLSRARRALVMMHGRGGTPQDMVGLADHLSLPDIAVLAPQAADHSWWPNSFLAPLEANEPGLSSGLSVVQSLLDTLAQAGFGPDRVALAGFSQGACLTVEAAARFAQPFAAVAILSGGLVGTADKAGPAQDSLYGYAPKAFDYSGSLADVPVLLGCHERDPHIPLARVKESETVLSAMGAHVETMVLPGEGHGIVAEEAAWLRKQLNK